jgi:chloride channel protein, CIC family
MVTEQQKNTPQTGWLGSQLNAFRARLAHADALPQLAILGCISGFLTALIAITFRLSFELPLEFFLPGDSESFEQLPTHIRFLLPVIGGLILGLIMHYTKPEHHAVSVGHVLDRMQHHQAQLPAANGLMQFVGGAVALLSGHSVGREGPVVHLGAASSSLLGQQLKLPNNSLRTLTACGVAAAIAASFNTPLAGVIFAMEAILMEYTITGFIPVILAAVTGGVMSRIAFGNEPAFAIPLIEMGSLWELPFLVLSGLVIGLAASAMLFLYRHTRTFKNRPVLLRMLVAGVLCGAVATVLPQIQGVGYDTVEQAMLGQIGLTLLIAIVVAKILVTTISIGLGVPGGIIGPNFVIGACLGGGLGIIVGLISPDQTSSSGFYAILGMGAMMGAVLNAPLAALIAVLELTFNPNILLPSMLVIVMSSITCRMVTKQAGIFSMEQDLSGYNSPVFQMLSRAGVTSLMKQDFIHHSRYLPLKMAESLLENKPSWIVIEDTGEPKYILKPAGLALHIEELKLDLQEEEHNIDLREIPGERWRLFPIHARATLQEARITMQQNNGRAVYISQPAAPLMSEVAGIITQQDIDNYYH